MSLDHDELLDGEARDRERLMLQLDHEDPLVAYYAKERVQDIAGSSCASDAEWIRLLLTKSGQGEWRPSSGYRFQALRYLLHRDHSTTDEPGADSGEDSPGCASAATSFLEGIFSRIELVHKITLDVFGATSRQQLSLEPTVCLDALGFLSSLLKRLKTSSMATDEKLLCELNHVMHDVADSLCLLDYNELPTFLSCAILDLLGDYQDALESQEADAGDAQELGRHSSRKRSWTECCVKLLLQSSCSPVVLRLFKSEESSDTSCAHSFIALQSRYPLLQHWIRLCSHLLVSALSSGVPAKWLETQSILFGWADLPDRMQLLEIVSEQDDVLVDMLNALLQSSMLLGDIESPSHHEATAPFVKYMNEQLEPNLLFAGAVATFGNDHLVILDLLISSETTMLEYLMRYLRHLASAWLRSSVILDSRGQLENVMDVLIRLRLDIEKLNKAGIFPYNPSPLLRRLQEIERLYENQEGDTLRFDRVVDKL